MPWARQFDPGGARQHPHAALRQAIGGVARHRPVLVHRGDVDDPPAAALRDHLLGGDLGAEERALQVDRHHPVVFGLGGVERRGAGFDAGVVDHHVEATELRHRRVDQRLKLVDAADVGVDADRLLAERGDLALQRFGRRGVDDVVDDNVGARLGEAERNRLADPAVAAGDDGGLSVERHRDVSLASGATRGRRNGDGAKLSFGADPGQFREINCRSCGPPPAPAALRRRN